LRVIERCRGRGLHWADGGIVVFELLRRRSSHGWCCRGRARSRQLGWCDLRRLRGCERHWSRCSGLGRPRLRGDGHWGHWQRPNRLRWCCRAIRLANHWRALNDQRCLDCGRGLGARNRRHLGLLWRCHGGLRCLLGNVLDNCGRLGRRILCLCFFRAIHLAHSSRDDALAVVVVNQRADIVVGPRPEIHERIRLEEAASIVVVVEAGAATPRRRGPHCPRR
jgi:hypothetical protein